MLGKLVVVGISSRTCPVARRELLALDPAEAGALAVRAAACPGVHEALVLSTCERTELYGIAAVPELGQLTLRDQLEQLGGSLAAHELNAASGQAAAEHLMRVASGLESSVPGEFEILGQLRRAGELCRERRASGPMLERLVRDAVAAGRQVREATDIARGKYSLSSVAVDLACRLTAGADARVRALVIGSGDAGSLVARGLSAHGVHVRLAARHRSERARRLSGEIGASTVDLGEPLFDALVESDVVISSTGAPHRLVPSETLVDVSERRAGRQLLVIDLAMPRDFDPDARSIDGIRLYDLDDLREVVGATIAQRRCAVQAAEAIASEQAEAFSQWMSALGAVPTIKQLRSHTLRSVLEALRRTDLASGADERALQRASQTIAAGLLHTPTVRLRAAAEIGDADGLTRTVRTLFALD
ncbi:MAG TPA: glutamyl-tRNA reductase [Thermoleophilaceae bacterium]|jgi:glutamyl-tRNA reductase